MQEQADRAMKLSIALRQAIARNELYLVYQPQIDMISGNIIGVEALMRWNHPEYGAVSPGEFIPIAEDSGQILEIGNWSLRTAVGQLKEWKQSGLNGITMGVNLSAIQLNVRDLPESVCNIMEEAQLPLEYLELELTERAMMKEPYEAIQLVERFRNYGVKIAIDDFGTGYSSLNYLKQFKASKIKIDQSFVRNLVHESEDNAIVRAIISMAESLQMKTIAEGVETKEQLENLREKGCNEVQGFYFSEPLEASACIEFIRSYHSRSLPSSEEAV